MFSNPGKVLKAILIAVFIVGCVFSIPLGTMVSDIPNSNGFFGFLAFVGGVIASYLFVLFGLCFAQLVENTTEIYRLLNKSFGSGGEINRYTDLLQNVSATNKKTNVSDTDKNTYNCKIWKCPKCGKSQPEYFTTCTCGEPNPSYENTNASGASSSSKGVRPVCNFLNSLREFCGKCGVRLAVPPIKEKSSKKDFLYDTWVCPGCGKTLPKRIKTCNCGESQPFDFEL